MVRPAPFVPTNPKYNLPLIIKLSIITVVAIAVSSAIAAHILLATREPKNVGEFLINGPHCKVPEFHPTSLKELKIIRTKLESCKNPGLLTSIASTNQVEDPLFLNFLPEFLSGYGVSQATCCFRIINRNGDSDVKLSAKCEDFGSSHELDKSVEHVYIECRSDGKVVYTFVHAIITQKEEFVKRQVATKINTEKAYKVLLLGLDNMSGKNFHRGMPSTSEMLKNKDEWIEMKGYTRVRLTVVTFNFFF